MLHSNIVYRAFLLAISLITLWYSVVAIYRYYNYAHLTAQTLPTVTDWHIQEVADDEFYLEATFTFSVDKSSYQGSSSWPRTFYRNRWAAEKDLPNVKQQHRIVWYNPYNPHHSSLQKSFPLKECISAACLWGLLIYFIWLGYYVTKFKT